MPLHVSSSKVGESSVELSVRARGATLGTIAIGKRGRRTFRPAAGLKAAWDSTGTSSEDWADPKVRRFLKNAAQEISEGKHPGLVGAEGDKESVIEAEFISALRRHPKPSALAHNALVLYPAAGGMPLQFPVPHRPRAKTVEAGESARKTLGHSDVLARHGRGPNSALRVFELKRPDAPDTDHALVQALEYAAALRKVWRENPKIAELWGYESRGASSGLKFEATAVVLDTVQNRDALRASRTRLIRDGGDIELSLLFYTWDQRRVSKWSRDDE